MSKDWKDTETAFAKQVLLFVNEETQGDVAWFKRRSDGIWETTIQTSSAFCVGVTAESEEALAVKYWEFYFKRVQASKARFDSVWDRVFSRDKYRKSRERHQRWLDWRAEHFSKAG